MLPLLNLPGTMVIHSSYTRIQVINKCLSAYFQNTYHRLQIRQ